MPYDSRSVSESRNARIDDNFSRKTTKGRFRVVWVDTFDGGDGVRDGFGTLEAEKGAADENGGEMSKSHVYNDQDQHVYEAGTF